MTNPKTAAASRSKESKTDRRRSERPSKLTSKIKAGGCAAKISSCQLAQIVNNLPAATDPALLTALSSFEDAAVYKLSEELALVQTIDFFPPLVDDPFLYGQVAAVNALSDIYAMGGEPKLALSVLCFPLNEFPLSVAQQIVAGGASVLQEVGATLVGGHSINAPEPIYGLSVSGFVHPQQILTNSGGCAGDLLVLTKPIGTGSLLLAHKGGILPADQEQILFASLTLLNAQALTIAKKFQPHAATDVTGFGLIGHTHELAKASGLQATIYAEAVPLLPGALEFTQQGLVCAGTYANSNSYKTIAHIMDGIDLAISDLLFDPQTSGGLLIALPADNAAKLAIQLQQAGLTGQIIGHLENGIAGQVQIILK